MQQPFKFEPKYYGARCNVPYIFPLTIVSYLPERKLVQVSFNNGRYENTNAYVPEEDILIQPENI